MLTQKIIENFYTDLENLGLRFPISAIAQATGFSKGNVSEYLNRKKEPSQAFIKKFYEVFHAESSKEVPARVLNEPQPEYGKETLMAQTIYNLSQSNKEHAAADRIRADAEMLREQNNKRLLDLLTSENAPVESPITFDAIAGGLRELLVDLGMGKHWKSREEGAAAVRNKLYGQLKKKRVGGIQND
jgi:transcriptional regulator with XRE-family HTH domain